MIWEGSEYRGRGRQTIWDGGCTLQGNRFERIASINLWNLDKKLTQMGPATLAWEALTTGGFGGFDAWLADARSGTLRIDTLLVKCKIPVADIGWMIWYLTPAASFAASAFSASSTKTRTAACT